MWKAKKMTLIVCTSEKRYVAKEIRSLLSDQNGVSFPFLLYTCITACLHGRIRRTFSTINIRRELVCSFSHCVPLS